MTTTTTVPTRTRSESKALAEFCGRERTNQGVRRNTCVAHSSHRGVTWGRRYQKHSAKRSAQFFPADGRCFPIKYYRTPRLASYQVRHHNQPLSRKKSFRSISTAFNISTANRVFYKPEIGQREYNGISRSGSNRIFHIVLCCYDGMRVSVTEVDVLQT